MMDKPSSTPQNTQEITITSIINSIDELYKDIDKIKTDNATTTSGQRGGSITVDPKESSDNAIDGKNEESSSKKKDESGEGGSSSRGQVMEKLKFNLDQMKGSLYKLQRYKGELQEKIERANQTSTKAMKEIKAAQLSGVGSSSSSGAQGDEKVLEELVKKVRKLRHQIPTLHKSSFKDSDSGWSIDGVRIDEVRTNLELYNLPSLQMSKSFQKSSFFSEIQQIYFGLASQAEKKKCLLCFAVFPENEELKKRTLTYWWEGEGLLPVPKDGETVEKLARGFLDDFVNKGLIETICKKRSKKARSYRMNPLVHGVVVKIAEDEKFFVYDENGNPTATFEIGKNNEPCRKVCLLKADKATATPQQQEKKQGIKDSKGKGPDFTMEKNVEMIFNFNDPSPDRGMKVFADEKKVDVVEWLSMMEKLKVLHLGRLHASVQHHIKVEKTDFLSGLEKMGKLRLFSLQGVSGIKKLESSIKGLTNLKILDLQECYHLESLPQEISKLTSLTHLDVSDCSFLEHVPKGLSDLKNLQVLKGFLVGYPNGHCTLDDLQDMQKLRKLSLNISKKDFPSTKELRALAKLTSLKKLTMSWGEDLPTADPGNLQSSLSEPQLPSGLEKLDLLCFPHVKSPTWLVPEKLPKLLKLCIRGGSFGELKNQQKWNSVKTLRLKFLSEVQMSWQELQVEFPNLECLVKVGCPRITFCPCDENGVWVNPGIKQSEEEKGKPSEQKKDEQSEQPKNNVSKCNCVCL